MGFVFGIINFEGKPVLPDEIDALGKAVGWGNFVHQTSVYENMAFGYCHHHKRDPRAGIYYDSNLIVLADIRIYNSDKLREFFDYQTAEEALAKSYLKWGLDCGNNINGDFAAMIFDRRDNNVHLLRDHIGVRPLVYWFSGEKLIFASHEFGLVKSGLMQTCLSEEKLIDQFFRHLEMYEQTYFRQVRKVMPGSYITFQAGGSYFKTKYWKPEKIVKDRSLTFDAAVSRLRDLIINATCKRMEQGIIGLHVSGGLDSCGVASIVSDYIKDRSLLRGYSWTPETFDENVDGVNEKEFIEDFSSEKGVYVKYLNVEKFETVKNAILPEFATQHIEHPVMQMACTDGVETLFSGWGGDEFVSLSTRGTVNHLFFKFKWISLFNYAREKGFKYTIHQLRTDVLPLLIPFGLIPVYKTQRTDWSNLRLFEYFFVVKHWREIFLHKRKISFGYGNRTKFTLNLLALNHLPERMDSWSINSERYGFEYKYPLLDKDVLEFWLTIPVEFTYKDFHSRLLFREAMRGILPEKIRARNDKGEAMRIAFSIKEHQEGREYLERFFYSLLPKDHLPFVKTKAFRKIFEQPFSDDYFANNRNIAKYTLYLRYVALANKYLS